MAFDIRLNGPVKRILALLVALVFLSLLIYITFWQYTVDALSDRRIRPPRETLEYALERFPGSMRINYRLARTLSQERDPDLRRAELLAVRAAELSPFNFNCRALLANIFISKGDLVAAEEALKRARELAPHNRDVRYRLANLLVREGKLDEAVAEFREAVGSDPQLLPGVLDLLWRTSGGELRVVEAVAGEDARARLALAQFLANQDQADAAARVFESIHRDTLAGAIESARVINTILQKREYGAARRLWLHISGAEGGGDIINNGGFEATIYKDFAQFNWSLRNSEHARVMIDGATARTGSRSLRIDFAGRDTTVLDGEVSQVILVRPGARYRLEAFVKTEALETPEGPRLVATDDANEWIAASDAVPGGSSDWQKLAFEFQSPHARAETIAVTLSIKRKPKNPIYDEPTRGRVWFDDLRMIEQ
jgi:tetratricopeptide (TPR) repeat protein